MFDECVGYDSSGKINGVLNHQGSWRRVVGGSVYIANIDVCKAGIHKCYGNASCVSTGLLRGGGARAGLSVCKAGIHTHIFIMGEGPGQSCLCGMILQKNLPCPLPHNKPVNKHEALSIHKCYENPSCISTGLSWGRGQDGVSMCKT